VVAIEGLWWIQGPPQVVYGILKLGAGFGVHSPKRSRGHTMPRDLYALGPAVCSLAARPCIVGSGPLPSSEGQNTPAGPAWPLHPGTFSTKCLSVTPAVFPDAVVQTTPELCLALCFSFVGFLPQGPAVAGGAGEGAPRGRGGGDASGQQD
jgi:hypothetical protein